MPNYTAYHAAFITAAVLALIGAILGLTVRDSDAASTMRSRKREAQQEVAPNEARGTEQVHA